MFGRRINATVDRHLGQVSAEASEVSNAVQGLIKFLGQLAKSVVDDLREFIKEMGDEVNVEAKVKIAEGLDLQHMLAELRAGKGVDIPLTLKIKAIIVEKDTKP